MTKDASDELVGRIRRIYRETGASGAAAMLRPLAEAGNPDAQYWSGCMYFLGLENEEPGPKAWFELAARQGHVDAIYRLSMLTGGERGVEMLLRAAEMGSVRACVALGVQYATGEGLLGRNPARARYWYQRSAAAGCNTGQYETGLMLIHGEGGEKQITEGLGWLLKAAAARSIDALRVLMVLLEEGNEELEPDKDIAVMWRRELERRLAISSSPDPIEGFIPLVESEH